MYASPVKSNSTHMSHVNNASIMVDSQVSQVNDDQISQVNEVQVSQVNEVPITVVLNKRGRKPKLKVIHDDNTNDILTTIAPISRPLAIGKALELDSKVSTKKPLQDL